MLGFGSCPRQKTTTTGLLNGQNKQSIKRGLVVVLVKKQQPLVHLNGQNKQTIKRVLSLVPGNLFAKNKVTYR